MGSIIKRVKDTTERIVMLRDFYWCMLILHDRAICLILLVRKLLPIHGGL